MAQFKSAAVEAAAAALESATKTLGSRWEEAAECRTGAVKSTDRHNRGQVHRVAVGAGSLPNELWVTACGWRFGAARHVRIHVEKVD